MGSRVFVRWNVPTLASRDPWKVLVGDLERLFAIDLLKHGALELVVRGGDPVGF